MALRLKLRVAGLHLCRTGPNPESQELAERRQNSANQFWICADRADDRVRGGRSQLHLGRSPQQARQKNVASALEKRLTNRPDAEGGCQLVSSFHVVIQKPSVSAKVDHRQIRIGVQGSIPASSALRSNRSMSGQTVLERQFSCWWRHACRQASRSSRAHGLPVTGNTPRQ